MTGYLDEWVGFWYTTPSMKVATRRVIFFSFLIGFLVLAPTLVLFTAGYRYNTQTGRFVRTGAMSVSTNPRGTSIYLNGEYTGKNAPHVLKRVIPGTYVVELRRSGFIPWVGKTNVVSSATAFVDQPYLLRDDAPFLEEEVDHDALWFSPSGEYTSGITGSSFNIWRTSQVSPDFSTPATIAHPVSEIDWSLNENYVAVSDGERITVLTSSGTILINDLEIEHGRFFFSTVDNSTFFVEESNELVQWNLQTLTRSIVTTTINENRVDEIIVDGRTLEFTYLSEDIAVRDTSSNSATAIALLPTGNYRILEQNRNLLLLEDQNRIILINLDSSQPIILERTATLVDWDQTSNILAFSNGYEIALLDINSDNIDVLTRSGSPITALEVMLDGRYIAASSDNQIAVFETRATSMERFSAILTDSFTSISDINLASNGSQLLIGGVVSDVEGLFIKRLR